MTNKMEIATRECMEILAKSLEDAGVTMGDSQVFTDGLTEAFAPYLAKAADPSRGRRELDGLRKATKLVCPSCRQGYKLGRQSPEGWVHWPRWQEWQACYAARIHDEIAKLEKAST